jgi:divalent metal cation (Fe/Co/Zn/Cd) transporter
MQLSPDEVLVAMKVDFAEGLASDRIEAVSTEIENELRRAYPTVRHVYLDATAASREQRELTRTIDEFSH